MPLIYQKEWFTVESVNANPNTLYLFGDNDARVGKGGQAIIRDCPNAHGIRTKRTPSMHELSFWSDDDYARCAEALYADFHKPFAYHVAGLDVVVSADGLGTGMSQLPERAPRVYALLQKFLTLFD
jgi:hypothetical protein